MLEADLIDYAEGLDSFKEEGSRVDALMQVLPDAKIDVERTGGWQGDIYIVIELDNKVWLLNDSYGSCSGCDAFLSNQTDWTKRALRSAIGFNSKISAIKYLLSDEKGYDWSVSNTEALLKKILCISKVKDGDE